MAQTAEIDDPRERGVELPPAARKVQGGPVRSDGIHWYPPGDITRAFMRDLSFVCGIRGPFRSGKSITCIMKLLKNARSQRPSMDGWRYRRTAIIRNTYPELRTTTMPSFFQWIPKHKGHWRDAGPPRFHIRDEKARWDWEVLFVALDKEDDVAKLLSMELSDAYINEAREVPKAIVDALTGRIGQFPAQWQGGCDNPQLLLDTNPPDTDHWWYTLAERDTSTEKKRKIVESILAAEEKLRTMGRLLPGQSLFRFYQQPSGRSEKAENVRNLPGGYYQLLMAGKDDDFIKVYVDGEYGFVMDGKPMYPEYRDSTHGAKDFDVIPHIGFRLGFDWGLTPAASISQRAANGRWFVQSELVSERLGIPSFAHELARHLADKYPGIKVVSSRGDPSGDAMTPEEQTCFMIMRANGFPFAEPAPTNDPVRRREAVAYLLRTIVDGDPAIMLHRTNVPVLRKAMAGGYCRKRIQVVGEERYKDRPDKNQYSHIAEALEYDCVSGGEDRHVTHSPEHLARRNQQQFADSDYDVLNH